MMNPYEELLLNLVEHDERYVVLTAENRGHMRTVPPKLGNRFIDVGIAEQTMIGVAAGLASQGRIVITHALAAFLTLRPFEFIRDDVGIPNLPVILVGMVPGVLSDANGPTHQAVDDVAIMRGIPNMGVFCPSDIDDFIIGMKVITRLQQPYYVRYIASPSVVEHRPTFVPGESEVVIGGEGGSFDVTILTYGYLLRECVEATHHLEKQGLRVRLVNMRTLDPVDTSMMVRAANDSHLVVTVEDHFATGGLRTILAETLLDAQATCASFHVNIGDRWFTPARLPEVLDVERLSAKHLSQRILSVLETAHVEH